MDYSKLPKEMTQLNQWVCCWNNSKIPMRSFERKAASSTDPETWSSFERATAAVKAGDYDHIGFVFADNGLIGIDIDIGYEDNLLTPICVDIINACQSYTEKSKSGRGVHIILQGELPFYGKNNLNGIEIYKAKRFFICTGDVVVFSKIVENQKAIDYVIEKYFPNTAREPSKKHLVERIYNPVWDIPNEDKIPIRPSYPEIVSGGRNISLTSLAGTMWNAGYTKENIYRELLYVNRISCKPPLPEREIEQICDSISRYRR